MIYDIYNVIHPFIFKCLEGNHVKVFNFKFFNKFIVYLYKNYKFKLIFKFIKLLFKIKNFGQILKNKKKFNFCFLKFNQKLIILKSNL